MPTTPIIKLMECSFALLDLIQPEIIKGFGGDLKWHFTKLAGLKGIFDTNIEAFDPSSALVRSTYEAVIYLVCI